MRVRHFLLLLVALCCLLLFSQLYFHSILRGAARNDMQTTPDQEKHQEKEEDQQVETSSQSDSEAEDVLRHAAKAIEQESGIKSSGSHSEASTDPQSDTDPSTDDSNDRPNERLPLLSRMTTQQCPSAKVPKSQLNCLLGEAFKGIYPRHPPEPWEKQAAEESRISGENLAKMPVQPLQRPRFYESPPELMSEIFTGDLELDPSDVLLDLGGGIGRLCIAALIAGPPQQVMGIELSDPRFAQGLQVLRKFSGMIGSSDVHLDISAKEDRLVLKAHGLSLLWQKGDFLVETWRTATAVVADSQLFPAATIGGLVRRLKELAPGTLVASSRPIEGCIPHLLRIGGSKKVGVPGGTKEYFVYAVNMPLGTPSSFEFTFGHAEIPKDLRTTATQMWEQMGPLFRARLSSSTCAAQPEGSLSKIEALARHSQVGSAGNTLDCLFRDLFSSGDGFDMSSHSDLGQAGTYGEITPEGVALAMKRLNVGEHDVVWDLGAGTGKVCLQVFLSRTWHVRGSIGVELSRSRHESAALALVELQTRLGGELSRSPDRTAWVPEEQGSHRREVAMVLGDILTVDFQNATVLYIANLLFPAEVDRALRDRLLQLPLGTVFIALKGGSGCLQNSVLLQELFLPMTWTREQSVLVYMVTAIPRVAFGGVLLPKDAFNDTLMESKVEQVVSNMDMPERPDDDNVRTYRLVKLSIDHYRNASRIDAVGTMLYRGFHGACLLRACSSGAAHSKLECFIEEIYWSRPALMYLESPEEQHLAVKGEAYNGFATNIAGASMLFGDPESAACLKEDDTFVDLGGGQGKLALGIFLATSVSRVVAIEQAVSRFVGGVDAIRQAVDILDRTPAHLGRVRFTNESKSVEIHIDETRKVLEWYYGDMLKDLGDLLKKVPKKGRTIFWWSNGAFNAEETAELVDSLELFASKDSLLVTLTPLREIKGNKLRVVEEYSLPLKCSLSCVRNDIPTVYAFTNGSELG